MSDHFDIATFSPRCRQIPKIVRVKIVSSSSHSSSSSSISFGRNFDSNHLLKLFEPIEVMSSPASSRTPSTNLRADPVEYANSIKQHPLYNMLLQKSLVLSRKRIRSVPTTDVTT